MVVQSYTVLKVIMGDKLSKYTYKTPKKNENRYVKHPNFLIITVDEERFPTVYENEALKIWRKTFLRAQEFLREHGLEFNHHYVGSTACSPSRTTLYTGQYPSYMG